MPLILHLAQLYHDAPAVDAQHPASANNQFTIGDLHGNALKLIYILIRQNVLVLERKDDYRKLINIYRKTKLTHDDLAEFECILSKTTVNPVGTVRLIGDELADRGRNDYFTLKVLEMLRRKGIQVEIMLSNHGVEFIKAYECKKKFVSSSRLKGEFSASMAGLQQLIDDNLITKEDVLEIVAESYKPTLRALSYTVSEDHTKITLYSHASIGLDTIAALAEKFDVIYRDELVEDLADTIDKINAAFSEYINNNTVHVLYNEAEDLKARGVNDPLMVLMWNRHYEKIQRPVEQNEYFIDYVHGHDSTERHRKSHIQNLDDEFGKLDSEFLSGRLSIIHFSQDKSALTLANFTIPPEYEALFEKIKAMSVYAEHLRQKNVSMTKVIQKLADELMLSVKRYIQEGQPTVAETRRFKASFLAQLHSQDQLMNKHKALWRPIVLNIGIALTGIGLFVLAGKLIQSKVTTGKCALFCTTTKPQRKVQKIEKIVKSLNSPRSY